jgi:hypothetical protein
MLRHPLALMKAYCLICVGFCIIWFISFYEPAHATPQVESACSLQQDVSFQSHWMIWQACMEDNADMP